MGLSTTIWKAPFCNLWNGRSPGKPRKGRRSREFSYINELDTATSQDMSSSSKVFKYLFVSLKLFHLKFYNEKCLIFFSRISM